MHKTYLLPILFILPLFTSVSAQKLPNKQEAGIRAPKNVKVDGKAVEWGQLQAYNSSTQLYYTVANNSDHLYFVIKATDADAIKKILVGGITFKINHTGKASDAESKSLTFPLIKFTDVTSIAIKYSQPVDAPDSVKARYQTDSLVRLMNADMESKVKEIKLTGIKAAGDTTISIYNDDNIKAAIRFDEKRNMICEIAIPLKDLGLHGAHPEKFNYNVMLNGVGRDRIITYPPGSRIMMVVTTPAGVSFGGGQNGSGRSSTSAVFPTDFWGEYTLK